MKEMKKILILFLLSSTLGFSQSANQNYIISTSYKIPLQTQVDIITGDAILPPVS